MFPLAQKHLTSGWRSIRVDPVTGRRFWHKAADYRAKFVRLFMPFDGVVRTKKTSLGGLWINMENDSFRVETAHNSQFLATQGVFVEEGTVVGITGNSGRLTTGPHNHTQIINKLTGQRVDPELFDWYAYKVKSNMFIRREQGEISILTPEGERFPLSETAWTKLGKPYAMTLSNAEYDKYPMVNVIDDLQLRNN